MMSKKFNRILLKMSGEIFAGDHRFGIDPAITNNLAKQVKEALNLNIQIGIVIGGGNIFRGISISDKGLDRVSGDYLGMLATIMNSVALQSALENLGCITRVMSAIDVTQLAEPYIRRRALRHMDKGRIVIFAGGTGNPYFTTDTAAVLRAIEINANIILKGTKVEGVFSDDPVKNPKAKFFKKLNYKEVINNELRVMDLTAITLCKENNLPISIFNIQDKNNLINLLNGKDIGTIIS